MLHFNDMKDANTQRSTVGQRQAALQYPLLEAIPETNVKLFSPSNFGFHDEALSQIPVFHEKAKVEDAARRAGIPLTIVMPATFAESGLAAPYVVSWLTFAFHSSQQNVTIYIFT